MKEVAAILHKAYPPPKGLPFWWGIEINQSIMVIYNLALSGKDGMVLHIARGLDSKKVIMFAGELLERYGVPRDYRRYSAEQIIEKHKQNPVLKGEK